MSSPETQRRLDPRRLFAPVDIASLVYFRIAFGLILAWEAYRYFNYGWIERYYIDPTFHFHYYGLEWLHPWPGVGMYVHFYALGALAIMIAIGLWYRVATVLFFLGFTYVFLLDEANYLNHFYYVSLMSFLMILVPAYHAFSLDARARPDSRSDYAPMWSLWLLRAQIGIVYVLAGVAKLNGDWLRGEPMRAWMAERTHVPVIGHLFTEGWMVYLFVYGGLLIDLVGPFFLLWRRTRRFAIVPFVAFHLINAKMFEIGIFPWFMLAATLLFFPPDWPRRWLRWPAKPVRWRPPARLAASQRLLLSIVGVYVLLQCLIPFRHHLYPGNVSWTEEGHNFSWHMKLRDKSSQARFYATNPATGETWEIAPRDYLSARQRRKMPKRPRMVLKFCHHVAEEMRKEGHENVEVRAEVMVSLNGRKPQLMIDPTVDLSKERNTLWPADWILPLTEPFRRSDRELVAVPASFDETEE